MHSVAYAVVRCLSVHLSRSCIVSKRVNILNFFSPSGRSTILVLLYHVMATRMVCLPHGRPTILVFLYQMLWQYSGASDVGGVQKNYSFLPIYRFIWEMIQDRAIELNI